jgi:hypothetical protein
LRTVNILEKHKHFNLLRMKIYNYSLSNEIEVPYAI